MEKNLEIIINESGLEQTKANILLNNFKNYFDIASEWEIKAKSILVTSEDQKTEMEIARVGRLFLREKRILIEKTRKELKEQSLREGKAIDGIANVLKSLIEPIEDYLDKQEHFIEYKRKREEEMLRLEMEKKTEDERLAKEEADRIEREKTRMENVRLQKEAVENEKRIRAVEEQAKKEREDAVAKQRAVEEQARKEREDAVAKQRAVEEQTRKEREDAVAKQKATEEQARKEREEILAKQIECPNCHYKFNLS